MEELAENAELYSANLYDRICAYNFQTSVVYSGLSTDSASDGFFGQQFVDESEIWLSEKSSMTTNSVTFDDSKAISVADRLTFDLGSYYQIIVENVPQAALSGQYITGGRAMCTMKPYLQYAGSKYYLDGSFLSVIVKGNSHNYIGLGVESTLTVSSAAEGTKVYNNSARASITWQPRVRIYQLNSQEVAAYTGNSQIISDLQQGNKLQQESNNLQKEQNETSKGILGAIKDFFSGFFGNLIDAVVSLFVPSADEMSDLLDRLNDFFSDTFGFLYYPFEIIIEFLNMFISSDSETNLTLPSFSIMGYEVWSEQRYDLSSDVLAGKVFGYVRMGTGALLAVAFILYLRDFFDKRFGGGGS